MNFLESEYFLLGARLLALNLIGAVIIELLHRRILKSFPRIDQSKYSNNITPQLLIEFREKKIALANSLRKFFHLSVTSFLFLFITSVIPGYFYFPVIVIAWTRFYYRWESLRFKYHIESAERHKEAPPLERIKQLETLKSNTMNFAYFILILGCLWLYQSQITNRNYRESFLESSITLLNSEWCATDEYDFNVYGDLYYAGWPCIKVSGIQDVSFESRNFKDVACIDFLLEEETGSFGRNSFRVIYENNKYCIEGSDGFSVDMLEWEIEQNLSKRLTDLKKQLCREYQIEFSLETFNKYCVR